MTYLGEIERELTAAGVRGRWARRALEEARDHLAELGAERREEFGDPRHVACGIAAVVATAQTRLAALFAFGALAATGLGYIAACALVARAGWPDIASGHSVALGVGAALAIFFLPQLTFVAGMLMVWRAFRLPAPAPAAELQLIRRRGVVALAGAGGTVGAWMLYAQQFSGAITAGWLVPAIVVSGATLVLALASAGSLVYASGRPQASPDGPAGDVFDDLEPVLARSPLRATDLRAHPWRFAVAFAAAVGLVATAVGWNAEGSLTAGLVRGMPETLAVLGFYALFARVLALRPR